MSVFLIHFSFPICYYGIVTNHQMLIQSDTRLCYNYSIMYALDSAIGFTDNYCVLSPISLSPLSFSLSFTLFLSLTFFLLSSSSSLSLFPSPSLSPTFLSGYKCSSPDQDLSGHLSRDGVSCAEEVCPQRLSGEELHVSTCVHNLAASSKVVCIVLLVVMS